MPAYTHISLRMPLQWARRLMGPACLRWCVVQIIVIVLPLWEGRDVFRALLGRDRRPVVGTTDQVLPDPKAAQWDDSAHGESDGLKAMPATV